LLQHIIKYSVLVSILIAGCNADLYTKRWARGTLKGRPPVSLFGGTMTLDYTENRGMVFGILNRKEFSSIHGLLRHITLIGTLVLALYIFFSRKKPFLFLLPFYIILGGALGNAFDKIRFGFVTDFIHIRLGRFFNWPFLFNIADVLLCVGIGLLVCLMILKREYFEEDFRKKISQSA